jgi:hypothetical protein
MAITQKFAYAASYSHYKTAIKDDSTKFNDSIVFTGDGYIISRGNVIKGTILTNKDVSSDYGLKFTASSRTLEFIDENGTSIKSVTLPDISGDGYVTGSYDAATNKYTVAHKSYTGSGASGSVGTDSINVVTTVAVDNGHVSSVTLGSIDINKVKHTAAAETDALRVLVAPTATTGTNSTTETLKSTPVTISGAGAITGVTTLTTTGEITQAGKTLANTYAAKQTASTTKEGTVKLVDTFSTNTGDDYGKDGYAASSKAVYDAYTNLKELIDQSFRDLDTSIGNYTGAFQFGGTVTTAAELDKKEKNTGAVYIANGDFDITSNLALGLTKETVEPGDMIICDKEGKWLVVQRNITGAVTATKAFNTTAALVGNDGEGRGVKQINIETAHLNIKEDKLSLASVNKSTDTLQHTNEATWTQSTSAGGKIKVPSFSVDEYGRVTNLNSTSYTIQA